MNEVPLKNVRLKESYLTPYYKLVCQTVLPYQLDVMNAVLKVRKKATVYKI